MSHAVLRNFAGLPDYLQSRVNAIIDESDLSSNIEWSSTENSSSDSLPQRHEIMFESFLESNHKNSRYPLIICDKPYQVAEYLKLQFLKLVERRDLRNEPGEIEIICGSGFSEDQGTAYTEAIIRRLRQLIVRGTAVILLGA